MTTVLEQLTTEGRRRLLELCRDEGSKPGLFVLRHPPDNLWLMLVMFPILGLVFAFIVGVAVAGDSGGRAGLGFAALLAIPWCAIVMWDLLRRRRSHLRPRTLVTPVEILVVDYDHGPLHAHRLRDADRFKRIQTYDSQNRRTGMRYDFGFGKESVFLHVKEPAQEAQLESVLAQALALKDNPASQARAMADCGVLQENVAPPSLRLRLAWPTSTTWQHILIAYIVVGTLAVALGMAYS